MPKRRWKESEKGWVEKKSGRKWEDGEITLKLESGIPYKRPAASAELFFDLESSVAKIKYDEFQSAVGRLPRWRAVMTML